MTNILNGIIMTKPRVLISDKMDPNAARIFAERGCDVDVITGKTPDELAAIIGQYDGLAIRSSTKATKAILDAAPASKSSAAPGSGWITSISLMPAPRAWW